MKIQTSKVTVLCASVSYVFLLQACGSHNHDSGSTQSHLEGSQKTHISEEFEGNFVPELNLAVMEGSIQAKVTTFFKKQNKQSSELASSEKCELAPGKKYSFSALGNVDSKHRLVTLSVGIPGCAFTSGYIYDEHVTVQNEKVFYAVPKAVTWFKKSVNSSSNLPSSEKCSLETGRRYKISGEPTVSTSGHSKLKIVSGLDSCGFSEGFVFTEHFDRLLEGTTPVDSETPAQNEFARTMKHILHYEGGCSDHPNDYGGRTFKGITEGRARMNGWTRDVCTMPDSLILEIYRKDYWNNRAQYYVWPLNLAIMNTEVNSGGGKARDFLDRMKAQNIQGTNVTKASWYVDQQSNFYRAIVANNSSQRVFLQGWLNRSAYMQDVIFGRRSLTHDAHLEPVEMGSAKAME
jgi:hypothetical protein